MRHDGLVKTMCCAALFVIPAATCFAQAQSRQAPEITAGRWFNTPVAPSLRALRGRPVLVVFLTTRCPHCVSGVPQIRRLDAVMRAGGGTLLAVCPDSSADVAGFVRRYGASFIIGAESPTLASYGVTAVPYAVLVDSLGRIVWRGNPMGFPKGLIANTGGN